MIALLNAGLGLYTVLALVIISGALALFLPADSETKDKFFVLEGLIAGGCLGALQAGQTQQRRVSAEENGRHLEAVLTDTKSS